MILEDQPITLSDINRMSKEDLKCTILLREQMYMETINEVNSLNDVVRRNNFLNNRIDSRRLVNRTTEELISHIKVLQRDNDSLRNTLKIIIKASLSFIKKFRETSEQIDHLLENLQHPSNHSLSTLKYQALSKRARTLNSKLAGHKFLSEYYSDYLKKKKESLD